MRIAKVYRNSILVGTLVEDDNKHYRFIYEDTYFNNSSFPSLSLTMPKTQKEYQSRNLFPFFFNMLAEGLNRKVQLRQHKISKNDHFGLLLAISSVDTIGAIVVKAEKKRKEKKRKEGK